MSEKIRYRTGVIIIAAVGFVLVNSYLNAQNFRSIIEGYVYDKATEKAISGANVYLSNTTLGDESNVEGYFRIENIPPGTYRFVISHLGYDSFNQQVSTGENEEYFFEQALTPIQHEIDSVVVTSEPDREWERNLRRFEKYFLGETENGKRTDILNPEVLNFRTEISILYAEAEEELHILNKSLGYEIKLDLTYFKWNYISETGSTLYFFRFIELDPSDEEEQMTWQANRKKTYKYSPERFFKNIITGKYPFEYETSGGKIYPESKEEKEYELFEESNHIRRLAVNIRYPDNNVTVLIDDRNVHGDEKIGYIGYNESREEIEKEMYIDPNGNLLNPLDFTLDGVWYDYRLADKLPLNYNYEKD